MRSRQHAGLAVAGLAALLGSACEHGIVLTGAVTVPAALQQRVASDRPAVVVLSGSIPKSAGFRYRLAALCEPSGTDLVLPLVHDGFGCAKEGTVRAELVRPAAGDTPACGVGQASWSGSAEQVLAVGEQVVFEGQSARFGCSSGEDRVQIVLEPTAAGGR